MSTNNVAALEVANHDNIHALNLIGEIAGSESKLNLASSIATIGLLLIRDCVNRQGDSKVIDARIDQIQELITNYKK